MKILEKMENDNTISSPFFEHNFLNSALKLGFQFSDLDKLTYIDIVKVLLSEYKKEENNNSNGVRKATQDDIRNLIKRGGKNG